LDVASLRNGLWRTSLRFTMGSRVMSVSAQQSSSGEIYITLFDPAAGRIFFMESMQLVFGGIVTALDGKDYHCGIAADLFDRYNSDFVVKDDAKKELARIKVRDIMTAMYEAGQPVSWGGREFRVHYTDQIREMSNGRIEFGSPLLVLMKEQPGKGGAGRYAGDGLPSEQIPFASAGADAVQAHFRVPPYGVFSYQFRLTSGGRILEIY
jgi:hypothetical protein